MEITRARHQIVGFHTAYGNKHAGGEVGPWSGQGGEGPWSEVHAEEAVRRFFPAERSTFLHKYSCTVKYKLRRLGGNKQLNWAAPGACLWAPLTCLGTIPAINRSPRQAIRGPIPRVFGSWVGSRDIRNEPNTRWIFCGLAWTVAGVERRQLWVLEAVSRGPLLAREWFAVGRWAEGYSYLYYLKGSVGTGVQVGSCRSLIVAHT